MPVYKKLFEVCQKYDPFYLIVHYEKADIYYVCPATVILSFMGNEEVNRIQKKGEYRHVYLRKEDKKNDS